MASLLPSLFSFGRPIGINVLLDRYFSGVRQRPIVPFRDPLERFPEIRLQSHSEGGSICHAAVLH